MERPREKTKLISFHAPRSYVENIDELVRLGHYQNRSEAIRAAIRELLDRYRQNGGSI
ncbi:MAG: ribbon-helix-helix domain-containing protein [Pyrobaculum sp.]